MLGFYVSESTTARLIEQSLMPFQTNPFSFRHQFACVHHLLSKEGVNQKQDMAPGKCECHIYRHLVSLPNHLTAVCIVPIYTFIIEKRVLREENAL